jgi:hypothetical protein
MSKKKILFYLIILTICSIDFACAATANKSAQQYFKAFIMSEAFYDSMNVGFMLFAALKWYNYFNNFNPATAFIDIITPAFITFMAFNWITFLQFVQILPG